jgi:hypothetical protein
VGFDKKKPHESLVDSNCVDFTQTYVDLMVTREYLKCNTKENSKRTMKIQKKSSKNPQKALQKTTRNNGRNPQHTQKNSLINLIRTRKNPQKTFLRPLTCHFPDINR